MNGDFIDRLRCQFKRRPKPSNSNISIVSTDFGSLRVFDTKGSKPVLIFVPDGPNVIEHHFELFPKLSSEYRIVCFEFFGLGQSYPSKHFDYSFDRASQVIIHLMDVLNITQASLNFSCSNGFYAIKAAELFPERITHLFLSQTPSITAMLAWSEGSIPGILRYPIAGQIANSLLEKKLTKTWYKYALPKTTEGSTYVNTAITSLNNGGCFCLSGLVQGLAKESQSSLKVLETPATIIWGKKDYTHRHTDSKSILEHLPMSEIIEFDQCGHFPELEDSSRYANLIREKLK